jgi:hypothetical protein
MPSQPNSLNVKFACFITNMSSHLKLNTPISKLVIGKSSLCDHDDDLGYFGG